MRTTVPVALLASVLSANFAVAQSTPAQSKGAETRSGHNGWLFENGPTPKNPPVIHPAKSNRTPAEAATEPDSKPVPPPPPAPAIATVQAVPPGPPQKDLTGAEFSLIHVGSAEKEVLTALGPPSSRVVIPDDDGHLRETMQYWVKGSPMGTVRLDNGRVVQIETIQK
jgi:hypothetical protein